MSEHSYFDRQIGPGFVWFTFYVGLGLVANRFRPTHPRTYMARNVAASYALTALIESIRVDVPDKIGDALVDRLSYRMVHAAFTPLPAAIGLPIRKNLE